VARAIGRGLAAGGAIVVCGGLGGVMEAVCEGVAKGGGVSVGILPGGDRRAANRWVTIALPTGIGEARNAIVARTADAMIAVGGEFGTLSEIALALRYDTPVVGYRTWDIPQIVPVESAQDAVEVALALAVSRSSSA